MSILISIDQAEFAYLREKSKATAGNLSVQIEKLKDAGYIDVSKSFKGKMPCTTCKITKKGIEAFELYVDNLKTYIKLD